VVMVEVTFVIIVMVEIKFKVKVSMVAKELG
jgi:hypothetical protein